MKQRITYIVPNADDFNPEQLSVKDRSLTLSHVKAAKEHRVTFGLAELPQELRRAFEQWHELHLRWASDHSYAAIAPFTSRVTPGLHAFFTPLKDNSEDSVCPLLKSIFGHELKCKDTQATFIKLPILSERFSMSASSQYYSFVPTLSQLVAYVQEKLCPEASKSCRESAASLLSASSLDIDYDTISRALVVSAFWSQAPPATSPGWTETISLAKGQESIEVGVLNHEKNPDPEDIQFSGFLTVLGQDKAPKPTRFQTPTRHYPLPLPLPQTPNQTPQTYSTSISRPTGLHPILQLTFPADLQRPEKTCKLHAHLTLPSTLFVDKYQFTDALSLDANKLRALRSLSGATDLEAPDWVVEQWGSTALFEIVAPPKQEKEAEQGAAWNVSIPLHLRYLPAANASHTAVPVPWPVVFWACRADEGAKMAANPFDRLHLGYEALFGPKTRFMHVSPAAAGNGTGGLVEWIQVPVLDLRRTAWVEMGTMGTVLLAFLGLSWALFGKISTGGTGSPDAKGKEKRKKKQ